MPKIGTQKKPTPASRAASVMPQLSHSIEGAEFDIRQSEVVQWLINQPEILQAAFEWYRSIGAIVFDPETKTWKGRDS
jgi:hypothetical protein